MPKDQNAKGGQKDSVRCPNCKIGLLTTTSILVQEERRKRQTVPLKVCWRCKIVMFLDPARMAGWKIWDGDVFLDAKG